MGVQSSILTAVLAIALVPALSSLPALASPSEQKIKEARDVADQWLPLVDTGRYEDSWAAASSLFQRAIPQSKWVSDLRAVREPMGQLTSRTFKSARFATQLPGAPDGEYVVIQYRTIFTRKKSAIETITPMRDSDGKWRVSGYFIK